MNTLVWLHGDSLSEADPAALAYPQADRVFVFDRSFLEKAQLSFKRLFFIYECAAAAAHEIRVGDLEAEILQAARERGVNRLAVTDSPSPRWQEVVRNLRKTLEVEVIPEKAIVTVPEDYRVKRFTQFWKDLGREWTSS